MRKFAKILSLVLVAAALATFANASVSAASFKDVSAKDEALYEAVSLLNSLGIVKGQTETTFGTSKPVTREQMAAFIYRLMKEGRSLEGGQNLSGFTDLTDPTFYGMVSWASTNGIIKGRSETEFDPKGKISLQDAYVMLTRALGYEKDGPLNYPHDYIYQAELLRLDENLSKKPIEYTDALTRGQVAILIYNAFYAEMNETYEEVFVPSFENSNVTNKGSMFIEKPETICHKIYGVTKVVRRIVATPSYGLDISTLGTGAEFQNYKPQGGEKIDEDLIVTAAIVPEENSARLDKEPAVIEFEDLKLEGKADDYFLRDITMYIKADGTIVASSATGKHVDNATVSINRSEGTNKATDYSYYNTSSDNRKIYLGNVNFGSDKGYFYLKPSSVPNYVVSIAPVASDEDGRISFKAGLKWAGEGYPSANFNLTAPYTDNATQRSNHQKLNSMFAGVDVGLKHNVEYYDCNSDGIVDYFWFQPYTFGKIVDKLGDSNKTTAKHTGDSSFRAYYNGGSNMPEISVAGAKVVGDYKVGDFAFAYVAGPANLIKMAPADINSGIRTMTAKFIKTTSSDKNDSTWDNGSTIYAWDSGSMCVGHTTNSGGKTDGIVSLSSNLSEVERTGDNFAGKWRSQLKLGDTWELVTHSGRVMLATKIATTIDLNKQYAVVQYLNRDERQTVFRGGGIEMDGSLETDNYVYAYIGGAFKYVKAAEKNSLSDSGKQDDNYFHDKGIVDTISTYTVNSDGYYTFKPLVLTADDAKVADLADSEDSSLTYTVKLSNFSLEKFQDKIYRFVPAGTASKLDPVLEPNGMKYVSITSDTKIIVNYIDEDNNSDFVIYDANNLPNFDADDPDMAFKNAVVVLTNNAKSTITENLAFLYCEIGSTIVDDSKVKHDYAVLISQIKTVDEKDKIITVYKTIDPKTGIVTEMRELAKTSGTTPDVYTLYQLNEDGLIVNTAAGKEADLKHGSSNLATVEAYEADSNLLFISTEADALVTDENTVYALFDRDTDTVTVEDVSMLSVKEEDDEDDKYFNENETKLTVYVISEKVTGEDFKHATLVLVVRGR